MDEVIRFLIGNCPMTTTGTRKARRATGAHRMERVTMARFGHTIAVWQMIADMQSARAERDAATINPNRESEEGTSG